MRWTMRGCLALGTVALLVVGCGEDSPAVRCGDGTCSSMEDCGNCAVDCAPCPDPVCGDGTCNGTEGCTTCPADCGGCTDPVCGDGDCEKSGGLRKLHRGLRRLPGRVHGRGL
ncbi:MAG: solute carrier organic anion transporter [Desulfobacterales bacterium]|nr:solute carrier organic anion transporter [Desulfobacterales bacterium]